MRLARLTVTAVTLAGASLLGPTGALAAAGWSLPAQLDACPALEAPQVLFPSDKPDHPSGPGAVVWRASAACSGGAGARISRIGVGDVPGSPSLPTSAGGQAISPRGALSASTAPHGRILVAGSGGGAPIQGVAGGPFASLSGLAATPTPLALTTAYLGDAAIAAPSSEGRLRLSVERYFARRIDRSAAIDARSSSSTRALTIAMDFRTDALAVWAQGGSIYAHDMPASGSAHAIQRLASVGSDPRIAALISDDDRAIVAWATEAHGETSIYVDRSSVGVRFGAPSLLERFHNPDGLASPSASPKLIRLSSESVMIAWSGALQGHWVIRTAAIDLQGVGAPTTIAAPGQDALLADLAPGPDGDALVLWTQPQQGQGGAPEIQDQAIYAARGFDAFPKRTVFGHPEQVAPPGPNSDATVALDPAGDGSLTLWRGQEGALEYAIRTPSNSP